MARVPASRDGLLLVVAAAVLHHEGLVAIGRHYARLRERAEGTWPGRRTVLEMLAGQFGLHVAEIWLFGLTYWLLLRWPAAGDLDGVESAQLLELVYLSKMAFTTIGYGDISPVGPIRFTCRRRSADRLHVITWSARSPVCT